LSITWPEAVARANRIVKTCGEPKPEQLKSQGVHLVFGEAHFIDPHTVAVGEERLEGKQILIATGAHPQHLPIQGLEFAITHKEVMQLQQPPERLAIIGGGIIGMEFAYLFTRLGSKVTVFELLDHILGGVDGELISAVTQHATALGMTLYTGSRVQAIHADGDGYLVEADRGKDHLSENADLVMLATGEVPAVDGLNLENAGVTYDRGGIPTDETLRTNVPHIWAAGDVRKGAKQLSQIATEEGSVAAKNALRNRMEPIDERIVPFLIGLTPPVASVGLTEEQAQSAGYTVGVHRQNYADVCPAANVVGEPEGFLKIVFDAESTELLGAHAFGAGSPEMIQQVAFALQGKMTLKQAFRSLYIFPGLSEVLWYALRPRPGDPKP
jgi:pyruvate/2-oxoglutarate dehydrogenase complex dihydrolipoamide dehydrogenase (E3) component